MERKEASLLLY